MQIVESDYQFGTLKGAFTFERNFFSRLEGALRDFIGENGEIEYVMTMNNRRIYKTMNIDELEKFPFSDKRNISSFEIKARGEPRVSCELNYFWATSDRVRVSVHSDNNAIVIRDALITGFKSAENWYSFIFRFEWLISVAFAVIFGLSVTIAEKYFDFRLMPVFDYGSPLVGYAAFSLAKFFLFDAIVILIGAEVARQQQLAVIRKFVFGTLVLGYFSLITKMVLQMFHLKLPT